jgi:hypothetical protein
MVLVFERLHVVSNFDFFVGGVAAVGGSLVVRSRQDCMPQHHDRVAAAF